MTRFEEKVTTLIGPSYLQKGQTFFNSIKWSPIIGATKYVQTKYIQPISKNELLYHNKGRLVLVSLFYRIFDIPQTSKIENYRKLRKKLTRTSL